AKLRGSLLAGHEASDAMLPPSRFLRSVDSIASFGSSSDDGPIEIPTEVLVGRPPLSRRVLRAGYRAAVRMFGSRRDFKRLMGAMRKAAPDLRFARQPQPDWAPLPEWLVAEWADVHSIEPELFPEPDLLDVIDYWD